MKCKLTQLLLLGITAISIAAPEVGASVVAYPTKGQSEQQQSKDKASCDSWAQQQTGVNPQALAEQEANSPFTNGGGSSAARGAAGGAAGGAITGHPGTGAAMGAGIGGLHRRRQEKEAAQEQQTEQAKVKQQLATYDQAQKSCLEGKGYSVG